MKNGAFRSILLAGVLCAPFPLWADDVESGIDLWLTPPGTRATKALLTLPAGFFRNNSEAIADRLVYFKGEPLVTQTGTPSLGPADTVIERLDTAHLTTCGGSDQVRLRIAALHLVGESPLTVTYTDNSTEEWTVAVYLSNAAQSVGSLTISQDCADGGTFTSHFTVRPRLVFTYEDTRRVVDWNQNPDVAKEIEFTASGHWARRAPAGFERTTAAAGAVVDHDGAWDPALPATTDDFVVGVEAQPCSCSQAASHTKSASSTVTVLPSPVDEYNDLASHFVDPPSNVGRAFPQHRDRDRNGRPDGTSGSEEAFAVRFFRLAPLGLLALAAAAAVPWRPRSRRGRDRPPAPPPG